MFRAVLALVFLVATPVAAAAEFQPLADKARFVSLVQGKTLSNRLYGVELSVNADGSIQGAALGWDITGTWTWQNGYFCREMNWGGDVIPYNCQLVELRGDSELRFTVDQGAGRSAQFRLR